ncbi:hemagglutinin repeat-containing protein [Pseudomonas sp. NPDC079086]|uniref:hemagglutinin repeat-containing protein n=1 Tax=unclassified Pseudomonas TaxID=196821 RepID=UPI0037C58B58
MPNNTEVFLLSPRGRLRWSIAGLMLFQSLQPAFAAGLAAANGPGGTPQIHNQQGVPVINIVAPNASGLSHNQFLDFNVDRQGLVLNNALSNGQSILAGQLAANPQLQSQAASVILNEVISRNASQINGAQEIFGRPADYVLANPNGISVNGASFINAPRASLVVGKPELQDGQLQGLNTQNANGKLTIQAGGLRNDDGRLDLLAPQIDSQGQIRARDELNLTAGRNQVGYTDGQVHASAMASAGPGQRIDASLFGAMQAGRINIVSTAEGAGVKVGPTQIDGRDGVSISSAGDLTISGQAAQNNSLNGRLANVRSSQGDVALKAAADLGLAASEVSGRDVQLSAGRNLTLSSLESKQLRESRNNWNNKFWGITYETYDQTITDRDSRQHGSTIKASRDASLQAGADTRLQGSSVTAGKQLKVDSSGDLTLSAANEVSEHRDRGNHRKHLWKANWDNSSRSERSIASQLKADGDAAVQSGANLRLEGAVVQSGGDLILGSKQKIEIDTATRSQSNSNSSYSGDLTGGSFFGKNGSGDKAQTLNQRSEVNAQGKLLIAADDVRISGSQVRGKTDASVISQQGSLTIDGVQDSSLSNQHDKDSKLFGLVKDEQRSRVASSTLVRSELSSDSNLQLKSAADLSVVGALVEAADKLKLDAVGSIDVLAAKNTEQTTVTTDSHGFSAYAKEIQVATDTQKGSRQYRAGIRYEQVEETRNSDTTSHQGSELKGGTVALASQAELTLQGSQIGAGQGGASLAARDVNLLAAQDSSHSDSSQTTTGVGFYYTGGLDRAGSGWEGGQQTLDSSATGSTAKTSGIASAGQLRIDAANGSGTLTSQGAQLGAGDSLHISAGTVDNRAAQNSQSSTRDEQGWSVDLGANIEYKGITRPIEKAVEGVAQRNFFQPGLLDAFEQPNLGLDLDVAYQNSHSQQQDSTAVVSQFRAGQLLLDVAGHVQDQGTQYRADQGQLQINAGSHTLNAASDSHSTSADNLNVKTTLRVYTTTGKDINGRLSGIGGSAESSSSNSKAVLGSLSGSQGIQVQLGTDGAYEGSRFNGGQGGVQLQAGGDLVLNQANDRQASDSHSLKGDASLQAGMSKGSSGKGGSVSASFLVNDQRLNSQDSQAQVATFAGNGPIVLDSGGDLHLQGSQFGSAEQQVGDVRLNAAGQLDFQAATNSHRAEGSNLGGGLSLGASKTKGAETSNSGASVGSQFAIGRVQENSLTAKGGTLYSQGRVELSAAAADAQALHLQGTRINAQSVDLNASQGDILQESAQSTEHRNTWGLGLGLGGSGGKTYQNQGASKDTDQDNYGVYGRVKIDVDKLDSTTQHNSQIQAKRVTLNSQGDTRLAGATIEADRVGGHIGGNLSVESRKDSEQRLKLGIDLRLAGEKNQPGLVEKLGKTTGPLADPLKEKSQAAFDKHRGKLENGVDKVAGKLGDAKDSLVSQAGIAKDKLTDALSRSGSYDVNPEPRSALGNKLDQAKGYLADKASAAANGLAKLKDKLGGSKEGSYAVNDKTSTGKTVADKVGNVLFGDKSNTAALTPTLYLDVSHIDKDAVTSASGISASQGIELQVGGTPQLTGATLKASNGAVDLGGSTVSSSALDSKDYRADLGLNLSKSPVDLLFGIKDELTQQQDAATQQEQLFNIGVLRVGGHNDRHLVQAGIEQAANTQEQ